MRTRQIKSFFGSLFLLLTCFAFSDAGTLTADKSIEIQKKVDSIYTSQIGVRELTGHNDGFQVEQYLASTFLSKGYPWCASFVSWTFEMAGVDALHTAWAPDWFPLSKTIYIKGKLNKQIPTKADVFGIYFPEHKRISHVGFIDEWPPHNEYVLTVEGNTNDSGSREGNGVYRKRRLKQNINQVSRWIS